jgi:hypothetical protein
MWIIPETLMMMLQMAPNFHLKKENWKYLLKISTKKYSAIHRLKSTAKSISPKSPKSTANK